MAFFQNSNTSNQVVQGAHEVKDVLWASVDGIMTSAIGRLPYAIAGLLLLAFFFVLARVVKRVIGSATAKTKVDRRLRVLYMRLASWGIIVFGFFSALTVVVPSLDLKDLIAGLGFTSFVIGFATKDILNNVFSGLLILWREPFKWNDHILIGGNQGRVETIGVRATSLRKDDGELILIPNGEMYSSTITIHKAGELRRLTMALSFKFDNDLKRVKKLIAKALDSVDGILADPLPSVLVTDIAGDGVTMTVTFWTDTDEHDPLEIFDLAALAVIGELDLGGITPQAVTSKAGPAADAPVKPVKKKTEI